MRLPVPGPLGALEAAEADGIDQNVVGSILVCQSFGQVYPGGPRHTIGEFVQGWLLAGDTGHVDDPTAPLPAHVGNGQATTANGAIELEIEIFLPHLII